MTALAGLGLAACTDAASVTVTDGNPVSVEKQAENIRLNAPLFAARGVSPQRQQWGVEWEEQGFRETKVTSHRLFWDLNDDGGTEAAMLRDLFSGSSSSSSPSSSTAAPHAGSESAGRCFDLILGADLLFFESHAALVASLDRLLSTKPHATVLLCQPSRKGTMEAFAAHPAVTDLFRVELFRCDGRNSNLGGGGGGVSGADASTCSYDEAVEAMHRSYVADPNYSPTIHAPHLIRLSRR